MKKSMKLAYLVASIAVAASAGSAYAQQDIKGNPPDSGYVLDNRGNVVVDPFGLCWRDGYWTPAHANVEGCDGYKKPVPVVAPAPAPAAPAPAPAPAPAVVVPTSEKVTFAADAFFDFNKATLKPEAKVKMDDMVSKLGDVNLEVIIAVGHTDSIGSDAYNQKLSIKRAEAVKAYLVSKGIEANRVYTEGKGKKQPVAPNTINGKDNPEGRAKNRRVEIEVVGTRPVKK